MDKHEVKVKVYGADKICSSCVGAPSSKETFEWLQAAIARKYDNSSIQYEYIDIFHPPADEKHKKFTQRIIDEDLFYPVVLVNDEIVGEGIPRLKPIYKALENEGIK